MQVCVCGETIAVGILNISMRRYSIIVYADKENPTVKKEKYVRKWT